MDLGEVRAEADIVRHRLGLGGEIALEAVAQLVGIYGDVAGGAGAVGKNEGHPVRLGQLLAEAHAGDLVGRSGHVQQLTADHLVEEFPGLGAQGVVHPPGGPGQLILGHRHGVALREHQGPVVGHQHIHAQAPALLLLEPEVNGGDMRPHLAAELVQLRPAVADALHGEAAVIGKIVEAVGPGQVIPGADQVPQKLLQGVRLGQHRLPLRLKGRLAAVPVRADLGGAQLGAEGFVHRLGIGTLHDGLGQGLAVQGLQPGQGLLELRLVEGVRHVVEGTDGGNALAEAHLLLKGVPVPDHLQKLLRTGGVPGPAGQSVIPGLERLHVRAGVGDLGKFPVLVHSVSSSE